MIATIVQLLVLLVAGLLLVNLAWQRPGWTIFAAISIATFLELFQIGGDGLDLGFNLYIGDALSIAILGTGLVALKQYHKTFPRDAIPCLALLALAALSLTRGVSPYGLKAAGNSARSLFSFVTPALAIMLLRPSFRMDAGRLARWIAWAGLCFSAVALLRWGGVLPVPMDLAADIREVTRVFGADYGCMVGLAFIAAVYLALVTSQSTWWWAGAGMFGAVTLALQHRSVWVAIAAGLAWLAFRTARLFRARWLAFGAIAGVLFCVIIIAAPQVFQSAHEIATTDVQETQSDNSTWAWRVAGYTEATARLLSSDPVDLLIGPPAGWAADSNAGVASTHIHSRYVDTLAYYGIVGFVVLLIWFGMLAKRVRSPTKALPGRSPRNHAETSFLEALLVSELVYMVPYGGGLLQSAVLGLIWVAATQSSILIGARRAPFKRSHLNIGNKPATLAS